MSSSWSSHLLGGDGVPSRNVDDHPVFGHRHVHVGAEVLDEKRSAWSHPREPRSIPQDSLVQYHLARDGDEQGCVDPTGRILEH